MKSQEIPPLEESEKTEEEYNELVKDLERIKKEMEQNLQSLQVA